MIIAELENVLGSRRLRSRSTASSGGGMPAIRDQLEDIVNNLVEDEKRVRLSMEGLSSNIGQLSNKLMESRILEHTWKQHVTNINAACNITTTPPSKTTQPGGIQLPLAPPPHMSLTPASMAGGAFGPGSESAVKAMSRTPAISSTLVSKLKDSWQHLLRDRAAGTLTFNDEQFHLLEKLKMKETAKSLECLLGSCTTTVNSAADALADWCKVAQVQRVRH